MKLTNLSRRLIALPLAALALSVCWAPLSALAADEWPSRPVKIIVPFPAGGLTDVLARRFAQDASVAYKQPFVVENRAGAGGTIGSAAVAKAQADGYTLLVSATFHVINPAVRKNLPYNTVEDFTNIANLGTIPLVLLVRSDSPVKTLADYLQLARSRPQGLTFASSGVGGSTHLAGELLAQLTKTPLSHIPYQGASPAMTDLLGGSVDSFFNDISTMAPFIAEGKVRALGVTTAKRSESLPNVPTISEQDVPGYEAATFIGFYGPAGMPKDIVQSLNSLAIKSMNGPGARNEVARGLAPGNLSPEQFSALVNAEISKWRKVATAAGVKPE